ncbi:hypothetical protein VPARA_56020 [Variovorax paradoxus]|uniref:Uncharacterized protein n=1 Tax=Variovorax paradoxus TaxID=34073 RepID=A0A0H2LUA2_VARPD|nr:hypothetical protein VPARA_56020 [Variovorax paradoxus]
MAQETAIDNEAASGLSSKEVGQGPSETVGGGSCNALQGKQHGRMCLRWRKDCDPGPA